MRQEEDWKRQATHPCGLPFALSPSSSAPFSSSLQAGFRYQEPRGVGHAELEVKKSRFIGTVRRIQSPTEAKDWVSKERESHPGARHVVHAFLIGPPNSEVAGMHDDGEPKGTAGRPVLDAIRGSGLRNVLVTVTRYFGGTKLGTGGLSRAYGECARTALASTPTTGVREEVACQIRLPYEFYEDLVRLLESWNCRREGEVFAEEVTLVTYLPKGDYETCTEQIRNLCRGRCQLVLRL